MRINKNGKRTLPLIFVYQHSNLVHSLQAGLVNHHLQFQFQFPEVPPCVPSITSFADSPAVPSSTPPGCAIAGGKKADRNFSFSFSSTCKTRMRLYNLVGKRLQTCNDRLKDFSLIEVFSTLIRSVQYPFCTCRTRVNVTL